MPISETRFLLLAVGLHAALPVMAFVAPSPAAEEPQMRPIEVAVEVDVEPTKENETRAALPAANAELPRPAEETPPSQLPRTDRPATGSIEPNPVAPSTAEPQSSNAPSTAPAPTGTSEYSGPPPAVLTGPGNGSPFGTPAWAVQGAIPDMGRPAPAPTTSPKATVDPQIATKVLKDAMKEKDKGLGLDLPAGGTVASSVKAAVAASAIPSESKGTIEVRISPTGQVLGVRVASFSGGSADVWAGAAAQAKAALAGRALAMNSTYEKGAVVYVNVSSTLTLPDGTKSAIQQKGAGATFDLSNIGAHMQRVVRTSFSVVAVK